MEVRELINRLVDKISNMFNHIKNIDDTSNYNNVLSTFLVYCSQNNIKCNFPWLSGMPDTGMSKEDERIYHEEFEIYTQLINHNKDMGWTNWELAEALEEYERRNNE